MKKSKAVVYLKLNNNDKNEMKKEEMRARNFCKRYGYKIELIIKDYKDDNHVEDAMSCCNVDDISSLITIDPSMISEDVYELYERYVFLSCCYNADLVTVNYGYTFGFDIKLLKGEEYARKLKETSCNIH